MQGKHARQQKRTSLGSAKYFSLGAIHPRLEHLVNTLSVVEGLKLPRVAVTQRILRSLGAKSIVDRAELEGKPKALAKERWAAGIDVAGGNVLANLLSSIRYRGVIACCGLAAGMNLPTSVAPFILRGVSLIGVDSVMCPIEHRRAAWARFAQHLALTELRNISAEVPLEEVIGMAPKILRGEVRGRIVVPISRR